MKYYYPKEFACAKLTYSDTADVQTKELLLKELKTRKIKIVTPDFETIEKHAHVVSDDAITIGLSNIKGIGEKVADLIIDVKNDIKNFDLINILSSDIPKAELIIMAKVGMFDNFGIRRFEIINMINMIRTEQKYTNNELIGKINEKTEQIEDMYEALSEESGLDRSVIFHNRMAPASLKQLNTISDTVYNKRIKAIEDIKKEKLELIEKRKELINFIKMVQISLKENTFKITLEDKKAEKDLTGIYLGKDPLEMINLELLAGIAKNHGFELKLNPSTLTQNEEAFFPLLITGGFKKLSKNANEYMGIISGGVTYRSFDTDVVGKAYEEGLLEKDIFEFYLVKLMKKGDFINVTDIIEPIDISKNEIIVSVSNRKILSELTGIKKEPIKVFIEDENKFLYIMGDIKTGEHIKIYQ